MKLKGGSFKTLNLDSKLYFSIPYKNPTPIQRKIIPDILGNQSVIGIARTGSGKTHAYLIPAVQKAIEGKKVLILVPTRDLCFQVMKFLTILTKDLKRIKSRVLLGNMSFEDSNCDILIGTLGKIRHTEFNTNIDFLVVDEMDKIFEDENQKTDFLEIESKLKPTRQNAYFSATLPDTFISLVSSFKVVKIDVTLSDTLQNYFFYVPYDLKVNALMLLLDKCSSKTIVFTTTKYSVEYLSRYLVDYNFRMIYSSMDPALRKRNMEDFINNKVHILLVTDLAARGLDIPFLDNVINYDISDEKVFLHRVGRVARNGRPGTQFSLVSSKDIPQYFKISETYFGEGLEFGGIPTDTLNSVKIPNLYGKDVAAELKHSMVKAEAKAESFRKKAELDQQLHLNSEVAKIKPHSYFSDTTDNEKEKFMDKIKWNKKTEEVVAVRKEQTNYKDQFFIPYNALNKITETVPRDDNKKRPTFLEDWNKKKKILFNKK